MKACVYDVQVRGEELEAEVWVEAPRIDGAETARQWELVDIRGVSEGLSTTSILVKTSVADYNPEFADPPLPSIATLGLSDKTTEAEAGPSRRSRTNGSSAVLPDDLPSSLLGFAHLVLRTSDPELKCLLTKEAVSRMRSGKLKSIRPGKGEIQRIREEQGLIDEPPRDVDMVAPDKAPKRYVQLAVLDGHC